MKRFFLACAALVISLAAWGDEAPAVLAWDFTRGLQGWTPGNFQSFKETPRGFEGISKYDCTLTSPRLKINASDYDQAIVAVSTSIGGSSDIFIASNGTGFTESHKISLQLPDGNSTVLLKFPLDSKKGWGGTIERLRFDPVNPAGARIRIESFVLCRKDANMLANGNFELSTGGTPVAWILGKGASIAADGGAASGSRCLQLRGEDAMAATPFPDLSWLGSFKLTFQHKGAPAILAVDIRERHGQVVLHRTIPVPASPDWAVQTEIIAVPDMAYEGTLAFTGSSSSTFVDAVSVTQASIGRILTPQPVRPAWQGAWIWCQENRSADNCTAYLRKSVHLPDKPFRSACVQISCDDSVAFFVNGTKVCDTHGIADAWKKPVLLDIAKHLQPGANTFLAEARDVSDAQGFIANIAIDVDGSFVTVNTGSDWEASTTPNGPWSPAAILGYPPCAPWNALPYRAMGTMPAVQAAIGKIPQVVQTGSTIDIPVDVQPYVYDGPVGVQAVLTQEGRTLAEAWAVDGLSPKGVTIPLRIPVFAKSGPAAIAVNLNGVRCAKPLAAAITLQAPDEKQRGSDFPVSRLVTQNGVTWISVNGKLYEPTQVLHNTFDRLTAENGAKSGLKMVDICLTEFGYYEDGFNFDKLDRLLQDYLAAYPDGWLFFNFYVGARSHRWWVDKHLGELCRHEDGSDDVGAYHGSHGRWPSYSSKIWREDFANAIRQMLRHLRTTPFAARVIAMHPSCGISEEWFNWGSQSQEFIDYSEPGKAAFRAWLKTKYATDDALRKAWNRSDVTLANAPIPATASRANPRAGRYYDVKTQRDVLDYHEFQHYNVAETIQYFCHVIKEESNGNLLTGTYYGYTGFLFESRFFCQNSGHFNARMLLDSPDFDFFMAPAGYTRREVGGAGLTMVPDYTHTLNGKIFWSQADLRTHWSPQRNHGNVTTIRGDIECMNREFARSLAEGTAVQWMDFGKGWTMGDKRLTQLVKEHVALVGKYRGTIRDFPEEDYMLFLIDEKAMGISDIDAPFYHGHLVNQQRIECTQAGIPWRTVLLSDLFKHTEKLLKYRTFVFIAPDAITPQQAQFIRDNVMKGGRTAVFIGNPGIFTPDGLSTKIAEALIGQRFRIETAPVQLNATCTDAWPELRGETYGIPGTAVVTDVMLPVNPPKAQTLANLTLSGEPAALCKTTGDCQILWTAAPRLSPAVLRAIARRTGIPVVADSNDNFYAGCGFVSIHAHTDGEKSIRLIGNGTPREILTNQTWPKGTSTITLNLKCGDTRIFVME